MNRSFGLPNSAPILELERIAARGSLPFGYIGGLAISNDSTDATNDISIASGVCRSSVRLIDGVPRAAPSLQMDLELPLTTIKQLDVAFAPENYDPDLVASGSRSGGRSTSSISNTTWHTFVIGGGGLATDVMFHDSVTQSSVVAEMQKLGGYTAYRRIASIIRSSGAILAFTQFGDRFDLATSVLDYNQTTPGTGPLTITLTVPNGISVVTNLSASIESAGGSAARGLLVPIDSADNAAGTANADICTNGTPQFWGQKVVRTNTSCQIYGYLSTSTNVSLQVRTRGWLDRRGQDG